MGKVAMYEIMIIQFTKNALFIIPIANITIQ